MRDALDQFVDSDLKVVAQIYLEITHALISNSPLEKIEKVYSKDQALAQCRMWLQRHLPHAQLLDTRQHLERGADRPEDARRGRGRQPDRGGVLRRAGGGGEHPGQVGQHDALLRDRQAGVRLRSAAAGI